MLRAVFAASLSFAVLFSTGVLAADFKYLKSVTLKVGQSVILKGIRHPDCEDSAPSWSRVRGHLPNSKLGTFSNGGAGTTKSRSCGGRVGARGIKFTAKKVGNERFIVADDPIRITVK